MNRNTIVQINQISSRRCKQFILIAIVLLLSLMLGVAPVFAKTLAFRTQGIAKRDGILTGQLVFDETALQNAMRETSAQEQAGTP